MKSTTPVQRRVRTFFTRIEALETRIAPATLLPGQNTVTYQDVDGDDVTVTFSKPLFTDNATADGILHFDAGMVNGDNATPQQLRLIDLTGVPAATVAGLSITVTAKRSATHGGDGFVNVGAIDATVRDLGVVTIAGDLGKITAGDGVSATSALKSLTVQSLGGFGTSTGAADLASMLDGKLEKLSVKADIRDAYIRVIDSGVGGNAKIGAVTLGGSLIGGANIQSGSIFSDKDMGPVTIGGDLQGGSQADSGFIKTGGNLASLTIRGSLLGGIGADNSGAVSVAGNLGAVKIHGDLRGGTMLNSGRIESAGTIASVTLDGSIYGGGGDNSGAVISTGMDAAGTIGAVKIGGSIEGGGGSTQSGGVFAVESQLTSVTVNGSVRGGGGDNSGAIQGKVITSVKVVGSIIGGGGEDSGGIKAFEDLGKAFVGGSVIGGVGGASGSVAADGSMGSVTVKGDLRCGGAIDAGSIDGDGTVGSVTIGGSVYAGTTLVIAIEAEETIGKIKIGGSVFGTAAAPIQISAVASPDDQLAIASLDIKGSVQFLNILGGTDENPINAAAQLGKITVGGDWIASNIAAGIDPVDGNFGNGDDTAIMGAAGASKIASVVIKGMARGTVGGTDHFAIIAREVGFVKIGSITAPLSPLTDLVAIPLGATGDFTVLEIL